MYELLKGILPNDTCCQDSAYAAARRLLAREMGVQEVLDLGCGRGESRTFFLAENPTIHWVGLDIAESPEVAQRTATEGEFHSYDGEHIPFGDGSFDVVFSRQVFEHVREPHALVREVARVLKPGGWFVGSTSQLEPYHSYSTFGYTPYGWRYLVEDVAGMGLVEIRPSVDTLTLMARRGLRADWMGRWVERESPVNRCLRWAGRARGKSNGEINAMLLRFAGVFTFLAQKR